MSGFNNPVVGALKLIRRAIQSPDYQAGSAGWTVNQDGSAEFSNVTLRGTQVIEGTTGTFVYNGTPGPGRLAVSIAATAGTDPYGNNYGSGINVFTTNITSNATLGMVAGQFLFLDPDRFVNGDIEQLPAANAADFPAMIMSGPSDSEDPLDMTVAEIHLQGASADDTKPAKVVIQGTNAITGATGPIPTQITGALSAGNIKVGSVSITPVANTPTSKSVTFPALQGSQFFAFVTAVTQWPGTDVSEVTVTNVTATGLTVWIYRSNTTATTVNYMVWGV